MRKDGWGFVLIMKVFIEPIARLINRFSTLPGVGTKTAQRYAYKVISMTDEEVMDFANALIEAKRKVHYCKECGNFTDEDVCDICKTSKRAQGRIGA